MLFKSPFSSKYRCFSKFFSLDKSTCLLFFFQCFASLTTLTCCLHYYCYLPCIIFPDCFWSTGSQGVLYPSAFIFSVFILLYCNPISSSQIHPYPQTFGPGYSISFCCQRFHWCAILVHDRNSYLIHRHNTFLRKITPKFFCGYLEGSTLDEDATSLFILVAESFEFIEAPSFSDTFAFLNVWRPLTISIADSSL